MTNTRNRTLRASVPFILLHGTDGVTVTVTPTAMIWAHELYGTSAFRFTDATTKIIIAKGGQGIYEIIASGGVEKATGNPTHAMFVVYVNGVALPCCTADSMIGAGSEHSDVCLHTATYLSAGDYVEIYVSVDAGTGVIEDDTARLIVKAVPMEGWNNRHGSKRNIRGRL